MVRAECLKATLQSILLFGMNRREKRLVDLELPIHIMLYSVLCYLRQLVCEIRPHASCALSLLLRIDRLYLLDELEIEVFIKVKVETNAESSYSFGHFFLALDRNLGILTLPRVT